MTGREGAGLDVRRVVKAIENVAQRHGIAKDQPSSLARVYGYTTTIPDMDDQIAAEYLRLQDAPDGIEAVRGCIVHGRASDEMANGRCPECDP